MSQPFDDFAAIGMQDLPGHIGRVRACKENVGRGDLVRLAGAAERLVGAENSSTLSWGKVDGISGVQIGPGATALTLILRSARLVASDRVKATMAPLVAE